MNKLSLLLLCLILVLGIASTGVAQPWKYEFGTATGTFTAAASTVSETFLPSPPVNGGTARVRVGSQAGSFNLENQTTAFGTDSYLRIAAATGGSVNKFSIYNYTAAAPVFTLRFRVRLGTSDGSSGATTGYWYLFIGDGARYSDNSEFTGAQTFTGIQWGFREGGAVRMKIRTGAIWDSTSLTGVTFNQGSTYLVELYGNNTTGQIDYVYGGPQAVASNTYDMWIDGVLVGNDLPKAELAAETNIDSWMFYGLTSTANAANIFLDDIIYLNDIASTPLPVQLSAFSALRANNDVQLSWNTISEVNNFGFYVERKLDGTSSFVEVPHSFVAGHATTLEPQAYTFTDNSVTPGVWYYRLRQVDLDGAVGYSEPVKVEFTTSVGTETPATYGLSQNYPNPFNPSTDIQFSLARAGTVSLKVYDMLGREVATLVNGERAAGVQHVMFNAINLPSGAYFYALTAGSFMSIKSMMFVK